MSAQTRNVLFIGLTQAGKSSLIQSILKYAGNEDNSSTNNGVGSTKPHVGGISAHTCAVNTRDHFLEHTYTLERIEPDETTLSDGLVNVSVPNEREFALNLIDTPGICDRPDHLKSDVGAHADAVEEQQKIDILLYLSQIEVLHAVVFVVRHSQILSDHCQRALQAYLKILDAACPNIVFNCVHTAAPTALMLSKSPYKAGESYTQLFPRRTKHFFLENYPVNHDAIAVYAASKNLAAFLKSLADSPAINVKALKYPKSEATLKCEAEIQRTYEYISNIVKSQLETLVHEIRDVKAQRSREASKAHTAAIEKAELEKGKCQTQIETIQAELSKLTAFEREIPVSGSEAMLNYLSIGSILCTTKAYALTFEFDVKRLPLLPKPTPGVRKAVVDRISKQNELMRVKDEVCNNLLARRIPKAAMVSHLLDLDNLSDVPWQSLQSASSRIERLAAKTKISRASSEQLSRIIGRADVRVANCITTIQTLLKDHTESLSQSKRAVQTQREEAEELVKENRAVTDKWELMRRENERALEASRLTLQLLDKRRLGIGELTVLRRVGVKDPYTLLYNEILQTLEAKAVTLGTASQFTL